jgi:hypothetical protein
MKLGWPRFVRWYLNAGQSDGSAPHKLADVFGGSEQLEGLVGEGQRDEGLEHSRRHAA